MTKHKVTEQEFKKILVSLDKGVSVPFLAKKYGAARKTIAGIKASREMPDGTDLAVVKRGGPSPGSKKHGKYFEQFSAHIDILRGA